MASPVLGNISIVTGLLDIHVGNSATPRFSLYINVVTTRSSVEPRRYLAFVLRCGRLGTGSLGLNCVLRLIARTLGMQTRSLLVSTSTSFDVLLVFSRCNVHVLLL